MTDQEDICSSCGKPRSAHGVSQYSGRQTKCPVAPGDSGHTVVNSGHMRERQNMKEANTDFDGPTCVHPYGDPHEAKYEERENGRWRAVCQRHVDPTNQVREIHDHDD